MSLVDWSYVRQSLRHMTPTQLAARYAYRGVQRALKLEIFHAFYLTASNVTELAAPPAGASFGYVEPERLWEETRDAESGLTAEQLERALADGEECFGALVDGKLACQIWITNRTAHLYENVYVAFDPAYAYSRWAYTRPEFRGRHLQTHCKRRALQALLEKGYLGGLGLVSASNFSSLRSSERVGSTRIGVLVATGGSQQRSVWASPPCAKFRLRLEVGDMGPSLHPKG